MTQDNFNRAITVVVFVFFMVMYVLSWATGKVIDWNQLLVFIIPTITHLINQFNQTQVTVKNIEAKTATDVATITTATTVAKNGSSTSGELQSKIS